MDKLAPNANFPENTVAVGSGLRIKELIIVVIVTISGGQAFLPEPWTNSLNSPMDRQECPSS
jgi:hypothetical protein